MLSRSAARALSGAAARMLARAMSTRIAVVGSGPSGFYSAKYLLKDAPDVKVDVLDALPNPYGESAARIPGPRRFPDTHAEAWR